MKKFLLPLAAVALTATAVSAETVTFDFANEDYGLERLSGSTSDYIDEGVTIEYEGVALTFTSSLGEDSTNESGCRLWTNGLRMYNGGQVVIAAPGATIDGVTFTSNGDSDFELDEATWTLKYLPAKSNKAILTLTVDYTPAGGPVLEPAGLEFAESAFTVNYGDAFTAPALINPNELPVTWTSSNEEVATVDAAGVLTIVGGGVTTITAESEATDAFKAGKASYTLTVLKVEKAASLADFMTLAEGGAAEISIDFPLTVTYKNGAYTYVTDGSTFGLLYGSTIAEYEALDIIPAGWVGKYSPYNNLPEIVAVGEMPAAEGKGAFTPRSVKLAQVSKEMVNEVVIITGVTFDEMTPETKSNFAGFDGADELMFRNNFALASVAPGAYDVLAVPSIYREDLQVFPLEYSETTGVKAIEADGTATYFDLQGRAVKGDLSKGLYIKVQDGKATKVLVK